MTVYPKPGEKWNHYKGGLYEIITLAKHTETDEIMVIYKSLLFGTIYCRPFEIWYDVVTWEQRRVKRFTISENE